MLNFTKIKTVSVFAAFGLGSACALGADAAPDATRNLYNRQVVASQKIEADAEKLVRQANEDYSEGRYNEAIKSYLEAINVLRSFDTKTFEQRIEACRSQIAKCYFYMAQDAVTAANQRVQVQDFEEAIKLCKQAIEYYPECEKTLAPKIAEMEKRRVAAKVRAETGVEAMLPEKSGQDYRVQILIRQGQELAKVGSYQKAARKFQDVLMIDPYNSIALNNLRSVNKMSASVADERGKNEHRKLITELEWRWATPIQPEGEERVENVIDQPIAKDIDDSGINKKIRSIIIPRIDFEEVTIPTAIKFLQEESKRNDPEQVGVNIFLRRENAMTQAAAAAAAGAGAEGGSPDMMMGPGPMPVAPVAADPMMAAPEGEVAEGAEIDPEANQKKISLIITNKSLFDALRYLCDAAGLRMRVERYAVVVAPENIPLDDLETKIFPIEKSAFGDLDVESNPDVLKTFFVDRGIRFPNGTKIVYDTRISRLIVTNTLDNLRMIDEVIQEILSDKDPMVEITAKFIEVGQNDLKELGFDYTVSYNQFNVSPRHHLSFEDSLTGLNRNYYDDNGNSNRMFQLNGIMGGEDGFEYTANIFAANKLNAGDVLASPRITTLPGMTARIEMVREVFYVDEWEDSELTTTTGTDNTNSQSMIYIGPFPTYDDEPTKLGVVFEATPEVDKARRIIRLHMTPRLVSDVGATTYTSVDPSTGTVEYQSKPIFAIREIDTTVSVYDGEPVVLGGVIEEKFDEQVDQIPFLGELPLIGRLFQSRYTVATKKHLLIFITCRLVKPDGTPFFPTERLNRGLPTAGRLD
jgi:Flp pilus assembly secretin CpaC/tetratricopeptide (TPR) repeat protein